MIKYLNRETISYLICGGLTTAVGLGSFALAVHIGAGTVVANTLSTVLAVLFAYVTNKVFVFRSRRWTIVFLAAEFTKFCGARLVTFVLETALLVLLVDVFGLNSFIMKTLTMVLVIIVNYILSKRMVFKQSGDG